MLKIPQARLQQYVNHEVPDVQAGFRKGRGTRDQITNIRCIIEKAREFQKEHREERGEDMIQENAQDWRYGSFQTRPLGRAAQQERKDPPRGFTEPLRHVTHLR